MNPERISSIHKVSGGTEEQQEKVIEDLNEEFLTAKFYSGAEREKTNEEKEIIESVIIELNDFLSQYGAKPLDLKDTHVHILDKTKMSQEVIEKVERRYPVSGGYYQNHKQDVVIFGWNLISHIDFAKITAHELIHFLAYNAVFVDDKDKEVFNTSRMGLAVQPQYDELPSTGLKYFNVINEGVTEELTKRFFHRFKNISSLAKEYNDVIETREKHSNPDLASSRVRKIDSPEGQIYEATVKDFHYPEAREKLISIIKEIYDKRKSDFSSEEDIFTIFAKAAITGDIRELAVLIDSTLGSGTFKKVARYQA